ncbi:MAG: C39 family peptidase [Lachnospiraceae bacterium]
MRKRKRHPVRIILAVICAGICLTFCGKFILSELNILGLGGAKVTARLLSESGEYPARLLAALENNEEMRQFVLDYPEKKDIDVENIKLSLDEDRRIPLFLQWDERWGYAPYGGGMIGLDGCGPTCLSMVLVGLTQDLDMNPKRVAQFSSENGYVTDAGTLWALMTEGAEQLGLHSEEVSLSESRMTAELEDGHPIICSMRPGDFTTTGHFIVIYGVEDGEFLVNDPNSRARSEKRWSYEQLSGQIKVMWAFSAS